MTFGLLKKVSLVAATAAVALSFSASDADAKKVRWKMHSAFGKKQQEAVKEQVREHLERYLAAERLFDTESLDNSFAQWRECFRVL